VARDPDRNPIAASGVDRLAAKGGGTSHLDIGPDDTEIVARVCAGDADAYAHLVNRHAPIAVRTAALLGAGTDAEDVVQEAFVKAYAALGRLRPGAPFRPWLLRIVANETRNLHRSVGRRAAREQRAWLRSEPLVRARPDEPAEALLAAERHASIVRGLARLSGPQREVVTCRYLLDLDEAETAAVLGWPRGTVKSRLHRALRHLEAGLDDVRDESPDGADAR
jgi:RNA polymerase sigma-70 factor (ECF subfamily)